MFYPSHLTHTSTAKKGSGLLLPLALLALALLLLNGRFATPDNAPRATIQNIGGFPLAFVSEEGQTDVLFTAYSRPGTLAFMHDSVQIALPTTSLAVTFVGQQGATAVSGTGLLPGKVHEYRGSANDRWQNSLATYNAITYNGLYPGIDLTYDGSEGLLKGTYTVAPGADPALIRWQYAGATAVNRDPDSGDLHITVAPDVTLIEKAPIAYQMVNGRQQPIPIQYDLHGDEIGFIVGAYDGERPLIIDPTLIYSSFLGSNSDDGAKDVAIDASGNIYVTGSTYSTSFPGSGGGNAGYTDLFVTKINAAGTAILYTTLLGGNGTDEPGGIAVNDNGSQIWIVGSTTSSNFPTQNPFQPDNGGGVDAFILQLGSNGTLAFSSYYGGFLYDAAEDVALDSHDDVHITGSLWGGFFAKVDGQAYELVYSNMIGGQEAIGYGIALDSTDNIYVTGEIRSDSWPTVNAVQNACGPYDDWTCSTDAFVVKITPAGDDLLFSTYLGGSAANGGSGTDIGRAIAVDANGNIAITGETFASDFPTANAVQPQKQGIVTMSDAFITRLVRQGSGYQIGFSTYLGGSETEVGNAVGMNAAGQVFVAGYTSSSDFPVADAWQPTFGPGLCFGSTSRNCFDAFIVQFAPTGDMPFSTYWGSLFDDLAKGLALDNNGNVYVVGKTESPGFPTTDGGFQPERGQGDEAFVVKLTTAVSPPPPNLTQQVYLPIVIR